MPRWTEAERQRRREYMLAQWRDPGFRRTSTEHSRTRMAAQWKTPEFRRRVIEGRRAYWSNPENNPLVLLTKQERADYDRMLRRYGYRRPEALEAIGRQDLIA